MGYGKIKRHFDGKVKDLKKASIRITRRDEKIVIIDELSSSLKEKDFPDDFLLTGKWFDELNKNQQPNLSETLIAKSSEERISNYVSVELGKLKNDFIKDSESSLNRLKSEVEQSYRSFLKYSFNLTNHEVNNLRSKKVYGKITGNKTSRELLLGFLDRSFFFKGFCKHPSGLLNIYSLPYDKKLSWEPDISSAYLLLKSYMEYFVIRYENTDCFYSIFYIMPRNHENAVSQMKKYLDIFIRTGNGYSVYKSFNEAGFEMTRKMCHDFLHSGINLSFLQAVRNAQLLAIGGSGRLIRIITACEQQLDLFPDEKFWRTAYGIFFRQPFLDPGKVAPLIIYFNYQKTKDPLWSLKGRTISSIIKILDSFFRGMVIDYRYQGALSGILREIKLDVYPDSGFKPYEEISTTDKGEIANWKIEQVKTPFELLIEGKRMHHCVFSYHWRTIMNPDEGESVSIWSMTKNDHPELTICVENRNAAITEVRGRFDRWPEKAELLHIRAWADMTGLKVNPLIG